MMYEEEIKRIEQKLNEDLCKEKGHDWEVFDRFATRCKRCKKIKYY